MPRPAQQPPRQTAATKPAQQTKQPRQWVAGRQDAAWRARCRELAAAKGLTHAAHWRHIASEASEASETNGEGQGTDQEHTLTVPSATFADRLYVVTARVQPLVDTPAEYTFRCECVAGSFQAPCAHIGAALHSLDERAKALAEAARDDQRGVLGSWLKGQDW